ncbi:hypothetical protein EHM76_04735 [bacterium]|nr:MAG: hypothetical protein EHM76_04735 [bacterium]
MDDWNQEAIQLIKEAEKIMAITDITMFICAKLEDSEECKKGDNYYQGFQQALILVLEYIHKTARQTKNLKLENCELQESL